MPPTMDENIKEINQEVQNDHEAGSSVQKDEKILKMMMRMGYKTGDGLGKNHQGITNPVNLQAQLGRSGFGRTINNISETWDPSQETITVKEDLTWLENPNRQNFTYDQLISYIKIAPLKQTIDDEINYVDPDLLREVLKGKEIFNELDQNDLAKARARANPFETIKNVFFMNRAALKMANIDAATDFMFTNVDYDPKHQNRDSPYYFADVCAGPGGFTEYVLWRKKWCFKGFGFTLKGEHDFKVSNSTCASPTTFQPYYGAAGDGNICNLKNIVDFRCKVLHHTKGKGVHFMMSDGGFSVEGKENLQEVLSKQLYVCQCLMALEIVRPGGHFVTKLFDLFTNFSVGLVYLMRQCFEQVAILKPNSSRPANSERYLIGKCLKNDAHTSSIKKYLHKIAGELWNLKETNTDSDIDEIIPEEILKNDKDFHDYIKNSNNAIARKQLAALKKLAAFCRNPLLTETRQDQLRTQCLRFWQIPDKNRAPAERYSVDDLLQSAISKPEFMLVQPKEILDLTVLKRTVNSVNDWHYVPLISSTQSNYCSFFAGINNSKVMKLQKNNKWVKVKNVKLNKGTLIYGELVKEVSVSKQTNEESERLSLHVVDALRLENISLADMTFRERLTCIKTFCEALNFEESTSNVRIRPKIVKPLRNLVGDSSLKFDVKTRSYVQDLEVLGFGKSSETHSVNSILLLKTDDRFSFDSTYVLRAQVFIEDLGANEENGVANMPFSELCEYVKSLL